MAGPRILVFPDAGPRIGGGHVMRCLTLADALMRRGAEIAFAANAAGAAVIAAYGALDARVIALPDAVEEAARGAAEAADILAADWVLLDQYRLDFAHEAALRSGRRLAVLDDLADRARPADLVLNPGYGARAEDYAGLAPEAAVILAGPAFAPVRPAFAALRERALVRRRAGEPPRRALVFLGMGDLDGVTARVVRALRPALPDLALDMVLGAGAASLPALRALTDPQVHLHVDTPGMAPLCAGADFAIGAGGGAAWERATLGLPALTVILAHNQRAMADAMARDGLTLALDVADAAFETGLVEAVRGLMSDAALRQSMSRSLAALCDGEGAARVAEAILRV